MIIEGMTFAILSVAGALASAFDLVIPAEWTLTLRQATANWGLGLAGVVSQFFNAVSMAAFLTVVYFGITRWLVAHLMIAVRTIRSYFP